VARRARVPANRLTNARTEGTNGSSNTSREPRIPEPSKLSPPRTIALHPTIMPDASEEPVEPAQDRRAGLRHGGRRMSGGASRPPSRTHSVADLLKAYGSRRSGAPPDPRSRHSRRALAESKRRSRVRKQAGFVDQSVKLDRLYDFQADLALTVRAVQA
jgi:hypothetical protein